MTLPENTDVHMLISGMQIFNYKEDVSVYNNLDMPGSTAVDLGFTIDGNCDGTVQTGAAANLPAWLTPAKLANVFEVTPVPGSIPGVNDCYDVYVNLNELIQPNCNDICYNFEIGHTIEKCGGDCPPSDKKFVYTRCISIDKKPNLVAGEPADSYFKLGCVEPKASVTIATLASTYKFSTDICNPTCGSTPGQPNCPASCSAGCFAAGGLTVPAPFDDYVINDGTKLQVLPTIITALAGSPALAAYIAAVNADADPSNNYPTLMNGKRFYIPFTYTVKSSCQTCPDEKVTRHLYVTRVPTIALNIPNSPGVCPEDNTVIPVGNVDCKWPDCVFRVTLKNNATHILMGNTSANLLPPSLCNAATVPQPDPNNNPAVSPGVTLVNGNLIIDWDVANINEPLLGNFTLTVEVFCGTNNNFCSASASQSLFFLGEVIADISDRTVCNDDAFDLSTMFTSNATTVSGTWEYNVNPNAAAGSPGWVAVIGDEVNGQAGTQLAPGTYAIRYTVGATTACSEFDIAKLTINNAYQAYFDIPEQCDRDSLRLTNYLSLIQVSNGASVSPILVDNPLTPGVVEGFTIVEYNGGAVTPAAGGIVGDTYTPVPATDGFVTIRYTHTTTDAANNVICMIIEEEIIEVRQLLNFTLGACNCAVSNTREVAISGITGGVAPYTITAVGGTLSNVAATSATLTMNAGEVTYSVTITDSRGCVITKTNSCVELLDEPTMTNVQNAVCVNDPAFVVDINPPTPGPSSVDGSVGTWTVNGNAVPQVGFAVAADNNLQVSPNALTPGVYTINFTISGANRPELNCQNMVVTEQFTVYGTFDPTFNLPRTIYCVTDFVAPKPALQLINSSNANPSSWVVTGPNGVATTLPNGVGGSSSLVPAVPGFYSITHYTGVPSCQQSYTVVIEVKPAVDGRIFNRAICASPSGSVNLTSLFGQGTTGGGTFEFVSTSATGPNAALVGVSGDVATYPYDLTLLPMTITVRYKVGDKSCCSAAPCTDSPNDDCYGESTAVITIQNGPQVFLDLPENTFCSNVKDPVTGVVTSTKISLADYFSFPGTSLATLMCGVNMKVEVVAVNGNTNPWALGVDMNNDNDFLDPNEFDYRSIVKCVGAFNQSTVAGADNPILDLNRVPKDVILTIRVTYDDPAGPCIAIAEDNIRVKPYGFPDLKDNLFLCFPLSGKINPTVFLDPTATPCGVFTINCDAASVGGIDIVQNADGSYPDYTIPAGATKLWVEYTVGDPACGRNTDNSVVDLCGPFKGFGLITGLATCNSEGLINLEGINFANFTANGVTLGGVWRQGSVAGPVVADPHNVNIAGLTGTVSFFYVLNGAPTSCPCPVVISELRVTFSAGNPTIADCLAFGTTLASGYCFSGTALGANLLKTVQPFSTATEANTGGIQVLCSQVTNPTQPSGGICGGNPCPAKDLSITFPADAFDPKTVVKPGWKLVINYLETAVVAGGAPAVCNGPLGLITPRPESYLEGDHDGFTIVGFGDFNSIPTNNNTITRVGNGMCPNFSNVTNTQVGSVTAGSAGAACNVAGTLATISSDNHFTLEITDMEVYRLYADANNNGTLEIADGDQNADGVVNEVDGYLRFITAIRAGACSPMTLFAMKFNAEEDNFDLSMQLNGFKAVNYKEEVLPYYTAWINARRTNPTAGFPTADIAAADLGFNVDATCDGVPTVTLPSFVTKNNVFSVTPVPSTADANCPAFQVRLNLDELVSPVCVPGVNDAIASACYEFEVCHSLMVCPNPPGIITCEGTTPTSCHKVKVSRQVEINTTNNDPILLGCIDNGKINFTTADLICQGTITTNTCAVGTWAVPAPFVNYVIADGSGNFVLLPSVVSLFPAGQKIMDIPIDYTVKACKPCVDRTLRKFLRITRAPQVTLNIPSSPGICPEDVTTICLDPGCDLTNCRFDLTLTNAAPYKLLTGLGAMLPGKCGVPAIAQGITPGVTITVNAAGLTCINIAWDKVTTITEPLLGDFKLTLTVYCGTRDNFCSSTGQQSLFFLGEVVADIVDATVCNDRSFDLTGMFASNATTTPGVWEYNLNPNATVASAGWLPIMGSEVNGSAPTQLAPGTYAIRYTVGSTTACSEQDVAKLTINNSYVAFFDVPKQCGTGEINLINHVSVVRTSDNTNVPVLANGFSITAYSAGALAGAGSISAVGVYTPLATTNGFVTIRYTHTIANCTVIEEEVVEIRPALAFSLSGCNCSVNNNREVVISAITGGLAPYTVTATGGTVSGSILSINAGEVSHSVTVTDARGCSLTVSGACAELLDEPTITGIQNAVCTSDPIFTLSINPPTPTSAAIIGSGSWFVNGVDVGGFGFPGFSVLINNNNLQVTPGSLLAGTYSIVYRIPGSGVEELNCRDMVVQESFTVFESIDPTFNLPKTSFCVTDGPLTLTSAGATASVWVVTRPDGTKFTLTNAPANSGNSSYDPTVPGLYTITHYTGIDACQQSYSIAFEVKPAVNAGINNRTVCASPSGSVNLTNLFGAGTTGGGTFTLVSTSAAGPNASLVTVNGDVANYPYDVTLLPLTITVKYSVGDKTCCFPADCTNAAGDDCYGEAVATITINNGPEIFLDLPKGPLCSNTKLANGTVVSTKINLADHFSFPGTSLAALICGQNVNVRVVAVNGNTAASAIRVDMNNDGDVNDLGEFDYNSIISCVGAFNQTTAVGADNPILDLNRIPKEVILTIRVTYDDPTGPCIAIAEDNIRVKPYGFPELINPTTICFPLPGGIINPTEFLRPTSTPCGTFEINCDIASVSGTTLNPDANGNYPNYVIPAGATRLWVSYTVGDAACGRNESEVVIDICGPFRGFGTIVVPTFCNSEGPINLEGIGFASFVANNVTPGGVWYKGSVAPANIVADPHNVNTTGLTGTVSFIYVLNGQPTSCPCPTVTSTLQITFNAGNATIADCLAFGTTLASGYCFGGTALGTNLLKTVQPFSSVTAANSVGTQALCMQAANAIQPSAAGATACGGNPCPPKVLTVDFPATAFDPKVVVKPGWKLRVDYVEAAQVVNLVPGATALCGGNSLTPRATVAGVGNDSYDGGDHDGFRITGIGNNIITTVVNSGCPTLDATAGVANARGMGTMTAGLAAANCNLLSTMYMDPNSDQHFTLEISDMEVYRSYADTNNDGDLTAADGDANGDGAVNEVDGYLRFIAALRTGSCNLSNIFHMTFNAEEDNYDVGLRLVDFTAVNYKEDVLPYYAAWVNARRTNATAGFPTTDIANADLGFTVDETCNGVPTAGPLTFAVRNDVFNVTPVPTAAPGDPACPSFQVRLNLDALVSPLCVPGTNDAIASNCYEFEICHQLMPCTLPSCEDDANSPVVACRKLKVARQVEISTTNNDDILLGCIDHGKINFTAADLVCQGAITTNTCAVGRWIAPAPYSDYIITDGSGNFVLLPSVANLPIFAGQKVIRIPIDYVVKACAPCGDRSLRKFIRVIRTPDVKLPVISPGICPEDVTTICLDPGCNLDNCRFSLTLTNAGTYPLIISGSGSLPGKCVNNTPVPGIPPVLAKGVTLTTDANGRLCINIDWDQVDIITEPLFGNFKLKLDMWCGIRSNFCSDSDEKEYLFLGESVATLKDVSVICEPTYDLTGMFVNLGTLPNGDINPLSTTPGGVFTIVSGPASAGPYPINVSGNEYIFCTAGAYTIRYTVGSTTACEESATATLTKVNPTIAAPAPITIGCTQNNLDNLTVILNWLDDYVITPAICASSVAAVTNDFNPTMINYCTGDDITVTWTAIDDCGQKIVATSTIIVDKDETAPVFDNCPTATIEMNNDVDKCGANVTFQTPSATDGCSTASITQTSGSASGSFFAVGTSTVVFTAKDQCDNARTCQITIKVSDMQLPTVNCPSGAQYFSTNGGLCSWTAPSASTLNATASDNCSIVSLTNNLTGTSTIAGQVFSLGSTLVTWTATDAAGLTRTCTYRVVVADLVAPTVTACPTQPIVVSNTTGVCGAAVTYDVAFADNCGGTATLVEGLSSGSTFPVGTTNVEWWYNDAASNGPVVCSFTVTVNDTELPKITCPANVVVGINGTVTSGNATLVGSGPCGVTLSYTAPVGTDNCPGVVTALQSGIGSGPNYYSYGGFYTETYNVFDNAGNKATCSFSIEVKDPVNPTITCPTNTTVNTDIGECDAAVTYSFPYAGDNCPGYTVTKLAGPNSGDEFALGTTSVSFKVTDPSGNNVTCAFTVTVEDKERPVITKCPDPVVANTSVPTSGDCAGAVPSMTGALTASDNCPTISVAQSPLAGTSFGSAHGDVQIVTFTVTDNAGNTSSCQSSVKLNDNEDPSIVCTGLTTAYNVTAGFCGHLVVAADNANPSFSDNCSGARRTHNLATAPNNNTLEGAVLPVGTTVVVWTITDVNNNTTSCTVTYTVVDNIVPVFLNCPTANITVGNDVDKCGSNVFYLTPIAEDNCFVTVVQTAGPLPGALFPVGTTLVSYKATDPSGNMATCSWTVTVTDMQLPDIQCPSGVQTFATNLGNCSWTVPSTMIDATASDNCAVTSLTNSINNGTTLSGAVFQLGATIVSWTARDAAGNSRVCTFRVNVQDLTDPTVQSCPTAPIVVSNTTGVCGAAVNYTVLFQDNCDGTGKTGTLIEGLTSGSTFPVGTTTVIWRYVDAASNDFAECQFTVKVNDTQFPAITCPSNITVNTDGTISGGTGGSPVITAFGPCGVELRYTAPVGTDNCPIPMTDNISGLGAGPNFFAYNGIYTETWRVTDASGNATTCSFSITVLDPVTPKITCPSSVTVNNILGKCAAPVTYSFPYYSDNCPNYTLTQLTGLNSGAEFPVGVTNVSFRVSDNAGNSTVCAFTVTVQDKENPVIVTCPADRNINTSSNGTGDCSGAVPNLVPEVVSTDNCNVLSTVQSPAAGTSFGAAHNDVIFVTITVTDIYGNVSTCKVKLTLVDNENPTISCAAIPTQLDNTPRFCHYFVPGSNLNPTFADNCGPLVLTNSLTGNNTLGGTPLAVGSTTVNWTVTDANGNTAACSVTYVVSDVELPVAMCQGPQIDVVLDGDGLAQLIVADVNNDSWDNCGQLVRKEIKRTEGAQGTALGQSVIFSCADVLTNPHPVVLEVQDQYGNIGRCTTSVTALDLESPVITCPNGVEIVTDPNLCTAIVSGIGLQYVNDNCPVTTTYAITGATTKVGGSDASGTVFNKGTSVVTYTVVDASGNAANCSFDVEVEDKELPKINCSNITNIVRSNATGQCSYTATGTEFDPSTFSDNCTGATISNNYNNSSSLNGADFPVGLTTVIWTVTDASGNTITCLSKVRVNDTELPAIACATATATAFTNDPGQCGKTILSNVIDAGFSDNCPGAELSHNYVTAPNPWTLAGTSFPVGTTNVVFHVTDKAGNSASCSINVVVTDNEKPRFLNCPTTMVMVGNDVDKCSAKLNWPTPVADDNCDVQSVSQIGGPTSGTEVVVSATPLTVTYRATDINGNTQLCTFQIQVVDTQKPQFDADIVMPGNVTVQCDAVPAAFVLTNNDVYDNCTPSANLVINFTTSSTQGTNPALCSFYSYTITRTWTVTDAAGNTLTHVQVVTVTDTTKPLAKCKNATVTLDKFGLVTVSGADVNDGSTDNCATAFLTFTLTPSSFDCSKLGANTVTLTVSDPCGNTATCQATVTVVEGIGKCLPEYDLANSVKCECLNNSTNQDNGQFREVIQIKALAGQTWTLTANTGLFSSASAAPPAAPAALPVGTVMTAGNADGIDNDKNGQIDEANEMIYYTLRGVHVDGLGYNVTLKNVQGQALTISNKCYYPTPIFTNLNDPFCLSTPIFTITVGENYGASGTVTGITVDGKAATTFNAALLGEGQHKVAATFDAGTATPFITVNGVVVSGSEEAALKDPGCQQMIMQFVQVVGTPSQVVCNDHLYVSLDADCVEDILPDDVMEGTYFCYDDYKVELDKLAPFGNGPWVPAQITASDIGKTYQYRIVHLLGGNMCWGTITIEDKLSPVLTCPTDKQILCTQSEDNLTLTGTPTFTDCSNVTLVRQDDYVQYTCAENANVATRVLRTWVATDAWGNSSTCLQVIDQLRGKIAQVVYPTDKEYPCTNVPSSLEPSVTGWPSIGGVALPSNGTNSCGLSIGYTDEEAPVCPGSYKIIRTWKVTDWCTTSGQPQSATYIQYIKVLDEKPTIDFSNFDYDPDHNWYNISAKSAFGGQCVASGPLPLAIIDGVCNQVVQVKITTPVGNVQNGGLIPAPGLAVGQHDIKYFVEDQCGNITSITIKVNVRDDVPPAVACDEFTQVALGGNGKILVNATTFDDKTYDNCCLDFFEVARMNGDCNGQPDDFGPSVEFCCSDINDTILVVFRAWDCNKNSNDCMVRVFVEDKIKPICTSPANTTVTCENFDPSLWAYGFATAIDNCCLDTITVSNNFSQFDTLCSRGTITRTFRALDCGGNSQTCTQRIFVTYEQDYFVKFPDDRIVTVCDGTGNYGEPTFLNKDCELLGVSFTDEIFTVVPDACYKIERTWHIINWCFYNANLPLTVVPNPNPNATANNPANNVGPVVSSSSNPNVIPAPWTASRIAVTPGAALTDYSQYWSLTTNGYSYKQIIKIIDGQKPVIDDCPASPVTFCDLTQNAGDLWNESYYYDNLTMQHDLCEGPTDLTITAGDACSGAVVDIRYLLFLDLDNNGTMETVISSTNLPGFNNIQYNNAQNPNFTGGTSQAFDERLVPSNQKYGFAIQTTIAGNKKTASVRWNTLQAPNTYIVPELPYGTHKIKWIVQDGCGNETVCEYTFIVKDCKKPTVVCLNGLSVNIMPTKMIQLWASDFLKYTEDNCTPAAKLKIAIRRVGAADGQGNTTGFPRNADGTPQTSVTFTCADLGMQNVELWSIDLAGNADYCQTFVLVQDNSGNCSNDKATVAGAVQTEEGQGLEEAEVTLTGASLVNPLTNPTDKAGLYSFPNAVKLNSNYTVTPVKDVNPLNGVSTYDLVLISKHILGLEPLATPYKMIAADANKSGSITTFDIVELRKLILGIYTELPGNTSWRFVDKSFLFPEPSNPFKSQFPENKSLAEMQVPMLSENFVAVKVGDVNATAVANSLTSNEDRTTGTLLLDVNDRTVKAGESFEVTFKAADKAQGYQFTMNLDGLTVSDIVKGDRVSEENFGVFAGAMTVSVDGANEFTVRFRAAKGGKLSQMLSVSSRITRAEAYSLSNERQEVALRFNNGGVSTIAGVGFELYQNEPNPFVTKTFIGFHLPEAATATLTVRDETGRTLFTQKGDFAKGYNKVALERELLPTTGVLYYTLETATDSATKKMIQTK